MRVLAHIHTLNDADVIDRSLRAVMGQTRPVDQVLIVDNGSTDGTLEMEFPEAITVIRNGENLGTSGAVAIGLRYGLEQGFDWVWTFDADSAPRCDALEKLLALYLGFPVAVQNRTAWLACLPVNLHDGKPRHGLIIRPGAYVEARPSAEHPWYRCDVTVWSGTLFRLQAVKEIGLPQADYMLDWGEFEYGYRVLTRGYESFIHTESVMDHDIRGEPSASFGERRFGPLTLPVLNLPPIRAYYYIRNNLHFWLHEYRGPRRSVVRLLRLYKCAKLIVNAFFVAENRRQMLSACVRGYWNGLVGDIQTRY